MLSLDCNFVENIGYLKHLVSEIKNKSVDTFDSNLICDVVYARYCSIKK